MRTALTLVVLAGLVTVVGPVVETRQRAPEGIARAYLRAIEQGDLEAALATIEPTERDAYRERIALQIRNRYEIVTLVLGRPSVIDRLTGRESRAPGSPFSPTSPASSAIIGAAPPRRRWWSRTASGT